MTLQRILLKVLHSGWLGCAGKKYLRSRVWTVEGGEAAGMKMRYPQNQDYLTGASERPVQRALAQHLRPGQVFYDVGANMGFFSLIAAKRVGPTGYVCAFEPVAENTAFIRDNARLNALANVRLFDMAVGRVSGTAELLLTDWDGGAALSSSAVKPIEFSSQRKVRVAALDDLIQADRLRPPNFVKIDVEGAELDVIEGMLRIISRYRPALLYEIDDGDQTAFLSRWKDLDDRVQGLGYRISHLENSYANVGWWVGHTLALPEGDEVVS